jgi:hypothetical protein
MKAKMLEQINIEHIIESSIIAGIIYIVKTVFSNKKDIDEAFTKIRLLEKDLSYVRGCTSNSDRKEALGK